MHIYKSAILRRFTSIPKLFWVFLVCVLFTNCAHASIVDSFNLAPFVPLVLEAMMKIATGLYKFFVGNGNGIIYIFIYAFLGLYIGLYLVKMHFPKDWLSFFGFSGGGEMWDKDPNPWKMVDNVLKPCLRAIIAAIFLLQIKPTYVTEWLINPFLEFGSIYTTQIFEQVNHSNIDTSDATICPASISESGWLSQRSCDFLVKPVYIISQENNKIIKQGFSFLKSGLLGLMTLIPHGGEDFLNVITGILLLVTFISSNVFMALLIIQAIFDFCLSLIMYPFNVLAWVAKKSDKWFDILPPFSQIIDALKKLIISMIACAFILCINIAIVRALFNWSSSVFMVAAGGVSSSNVPSITNMSFGQHSILWLSALLTFFLMRNIFKMTRERLDMYTSGTKHDLYNNVTGAASIYWNKIKSVPDKIKVINETIHKIKK